MKELQNKVSKFVIENNLESDVSSRLLDLVSEIGELSKEILISTDFGKQKFIPNGNWKEEIGDVMFSLICLANSTDIDLEDALNNILDKYNSRIGEKGDPSSGV